MTKKIEITKGAPSVEEFMKRFKTEKDAFNFIIKHIYPDGKVICPYCGCSDYIYSSKQHLGKYTCANCSNHIAILNGTIFEALYGRYRKWLYIIYASFISRKSISTLQLAREINLGVETILTFRRRMQVAMGNYDLEPFTGVIQMDEIYCGGSNHGRYCRELEGIGQAKYPVFGIYESKTQRVYTCIAKENEKGQCLTSNQIKDFIECICQKGSTIVTDEFKGYNFLGKKDSGYKHKKVNHKDKEYVNNAGYTTNGIESYFGRLKKIYYSTHVFFSKKWAHLYFFESDFRQNHQEWNEAIDTILSQCVLFPKVIDIRKLGKFANKTYDLKNFKMILPKKFDNIDLKDIAIDDILNCDEPVYGILKVPYLSRKEQRMKENKRAGRDRFTDDWKKLGFEKYFPGYKDYRKNITNDVSYIGEMIKEAVKHKDVNNRALNIPRKTPRPLKDPARTRQLQMQKSYNNLPQILQIQIKSEYPNILKISDKEKTKEIHLRLRVLRNWYKKNKYVIEQ